jgi:tyrosine-protein phosphatase YwqE
MSIFSKLFGAKLPEAHDLSALHTDLHSHLIPGIDDGVATVEESIAMIKGLMEFGYRKFITTPHILPGMYNNGPDTILPGLALVRKAIAEQHLGVTLDAAAEYYYDEAFEEMAKDAPLMLFSGNHLFFELPNMHQPPMLKHTVFALNIRGIIPVLAHVERYPYLYEKNFSELEELVNMGVELQVNYGTFLGVYGPKLQKAAYQMVDAGLISYLGSDLHGEKHLQYIHGAFKDKKFRQMLAKHKFKNKDL